MKRRVSTSAHFWKIPAVICGVLVILTALGIAAWLGINYSAFKYLQKKLEVKVEGHFVPSLCDSSWQIENARFDWDGKVEWISGNLRVHYDFLLYFSSKKLRIQLSGKHAVIKLRGKWSEVSGKQPFPVDQFQTDLLIGPQGLEKIHGIHISSPVFQLRLGDLQNVAA